MSFANSSRARQPSPEAIDLTLSSPEPEERPTPSQRPQHHAGISKSSLPHRTIAVKDENSHSIPSAGNSLSYEQSKRIKSEDIAHIVNTTDSGHLRKVVIELCSMSPELSGAVARALAPRSRYAHALGIAHNPRPQVRASQFQDTGDNRTPVRHNPFAIKNEYVPKDRTTPTQNRSSFPTPQSRGHSAVTTPYTSSSNRSPAQSSLSRVKSESSSLSKSRALYDEELSRPGPSKPRTPHTQTPGAPVQVKPEPSSITKPKSAHLPEEAINPHQSAQTTKGPRMCQQCFQPFTDVDDLCIWHTGSLADEDGSKRWSCCGEVPSDLGCEFSSHIPEDCSSTG